MYSEHVVSVNSALPCTRSFLRANYIVYSSPRKR